MRDYTWTHPKSGQMIAVADMATVEIIEVLYNDDGIASGDGTSPAAIRDRLKLELFIRDMGL